jgi:hypothetical protein
MREICSAGSLGTPCRGLPGSTQRLTTQLCTLLQQNKNFFSQSLWHFFYISKYGLASALQTCLVLHVQNEIHRPKRS